MGTFSYKVMDRAGRVVSGELEGESEQIVLSKLRQMGYIVIELGAKVGSPNVGETLSRFQKIKTETVTLFSRQFATMISSGLPLLRSLSILSEQAENKRFAAVIDGVRKDVEGGSSLSEALARRPRVFSNLYVSMVKAGELGGVLDEVLNRLATVLEKEAFIKGKVKSAMTYPTLMLGFSLIIVFFLVTFIVPVFADMFKDLGGDLPAATRILMNVSGFLRGNLPFIVVGVVGGVIAFKRWSNTEGGRWKIDSFKLRLPLLGPIVRRSAVARFTRTFGTLVTSGVPMMQALDIVAHTSGNVVIRTAVEKAKDSVREGDALAPPLASSGVFPPMVTQMIGVGEETGALDDMLRRIADFYDQEVETAVETLTSMIEPIMIVFMGTLIGGIVMAMYMPMFQLMNTVK